MKRIDGRIGPEREGEVGAGNPGIFDVINGKCAWKHLDLIAERIDDHRSRQISGVEDDDFTKWNGNLRAVENNFLRNHIGYSMSQGKLNEHVADSQVRLGDGHGCRLARSRGKLNFPSTMADAALFKYNKDQQVDDAGDSK